VNRVSPKYLRATLGKIFFKNKIPKKNENTFLQFPKKGTKNNNYGS
jgi:hypothetical protein